MKKTIILTILTILIIGFLGFVTYKVFISTTLAKEYGKDLKEIILKDKTKQPILDELENNILAIQDIFNNEYSNIDIEFRIEYAADFGEKNWWIKVIKKKDNYERKIYNYDKSLKNTLIKTFNDVSLYDK